jgi:hypothetical protein
LSFSHRKYQCIPNASKHENTNNPVQIAYPTKNRGPAPSENAHGNAIGIVFPTDTAIDNPNERFVSVGQFPEIQANIKGSAGLLLADNPSVVEYKDPHETRKTAKYLTPGTGTVNNNTYPTAPTNVKRETHLPRSLILSLFHATTIMPINELANGGTFIKAFFGISLHPHSPMILGKK